MITEKEHQENLNGLIKQWKAKRKYYGELADALIYVFEWELRYSIKEYGNLI